MAEEDQATEQLKKALRRVWAIPRPKVREKILMETLKAIAQELNIEFEERKPNAT